MEENENISEKEQERRRKISEARKKAIEEKRRKGYRAFVAKRRRERRKAETIKRREEEKEKKKRLKEKERAKKKPGRKKKSGRPKKYYTKVRIKNTKALPEVKYKIISCRNGIQNKFIGGYRTSEEAYEVFNNLKLKDNKVVFPSLSTGNPPKKNAIDEYILIKKTNKVNYGLRNEYGKIVEQKTNVEGWNVIDKFRYKKEETFWVWGLDNHKERKDFMWIYENIILSGLELTMNYNRVYVYKNKVLVKNDSGDIDMIICKNDNDAVAFYNKVEETAKNDKIRQVLLIGDYGNTLKRRRIVEKEIRELTGWNDRKIKRNTTTG